MSTAEECGTIRVDGAGGRRFPPSLASHLVADIFQPCMNRMARSGD
jgi:hypothetical protein